MLRETLKALKAILDPIRIRWVLIGALAANRYRSTARMTGDVDLLLADTGPGLADLEQTLSDHGWTVRHADPQGELLRITHQDHGVADLLIAGTEFQLQSIGRAVTEVIESEEIPVLTVEDVIIHQLIAGRYQDLADVESSA